MEVVLGEEGATNKFVQLVLLSGRCEFCRYRYFIICAMQEEKGTLHCILKDMISGTL
jgi:hypothetical protein